MTITTDAILLIIGALALAAVQIITAWRSERKIDVVEAKADVIAGHVNSAATASATKIDALMERVKSLTASLAEEKKTAELLAQRAEPTKRK